MTLCIAWMMSVVVLMVIPSPYFVEHLCQFRILRSAARRPRAQRPVALLPTLTDGVTIADKHLYPG